MRPLTLLALLTLFVSCVKQPEPTSFAVVPQAKDLVTDSQFVTKEKEAYATIEFYSGPNCVWCDRWKAIMLPDCVDKGWSVEKLDASTRPIPYFRVRVGGKRSERFVGYMTGNDLRKILVQMGVK